MYIYIYIYIYIYAHPAQPHPPTHTYTYTHARTRTHVLTQEHGCLLDDFQRKGSKTYRFWTNTFVADMTEKAELAAPLGKPLDDLATKENRTADIEQIDRDSMERETKSVILYVVKPDKSGSKISYDEAVRLGVIRPLEGVYFDSENGVSMTIAAAKESGLIKVVREETTDVYHRTTSIGIITVKIAGEGSGLKVDKIYAVLAVVDHQMKMAITFRDAVRANILDREAGTYHDNVADEKMFVEDAIKRGFLKARVIDVEEYRSLDVDPLNRMVVEKTEKIRKNIVKPLGAIGALKMAGKVDGNK